ncbi:hypothetical protein COCNU_11G005000 [Cocos nucifera]|uniref:Uncharacterized protein n=1 Tax=Cocos nucifera TaxID=13894 RepID=A0A8K0IPC2_COCNU|nr:hypothetical protein COCNU_11G005000 [Cocos nucifera]
MKAYKFFEGFMEEIMEALGEAFDSGFNSCKNLVRKFFLDLDLSGIIQEAGLTLASEMEAQSVLEVDLPAEAPQPALEVPTVLVKPKVKPSAPFEAPTATPTVVPPPNPAPAEVSALVEVISLEDETAATPAEASLPAEASQVNA